MRQSNGRSSIVHAFLKQLLTFHFKKKRKVRHDFKDNMHRKHKHMLFPGVDVNVNLSINQLDMNRPNAKSSVS